MKARVARPIVILAAIAAVIACFFLMERRPAAPPIAAMSAVNQPQHEPASTDSRGTVIDAGNTDFQLPDIDAGSTDSLDAAATAAVDSFDVHLTPLRVDRDYSWDGTSQMQGETLEKAKRIHSRFKENFAKIKRIKLTTPWGEEVEAVRDPYFFHLVSGEGEWRVDAVVTATGILNRTKMRLGLNYDPVEMYLGGQMTAFFDSVMRAPLTVKEDVPIDDALREFEPARASIIDRNARHDVLEDAQDIGIFHVSTSYWFNRDTGMLEYVLWRNGEGRSLTGVDVFRYRRFGDAFYYDTHELWRPEKAPEEDLASGKLVHELRRFTVHEINGHPVQ